ncbi:MAG: hypothetical protein H6696_13450 [Deferribacteres bacterium]|nr:hypothetical protein [candidate division KSB1 bacterium]MCB9502937.1 hypothetical protein [Deferribacteres bacterium]
MADNYGKGRLVYKLLIIVLTIALVGSIYYPKTLWDKEAKNVELSHYRMSNIYNAELQYHFFHESYTDTLDQLLSFIKNDTGYHIYVDSLFTKSLENLIVKFDSMKTQQGDLESFIQTIEPTDTVMTDSLGGRIENMIWGVRRLGDEMQILGDKMKNHPCSPIHYLEAAREIAERKDFFMDFKIVQNMVVQNKLPIAMAASERTKQNYDLIIQNLRGTIDNLNNIFSEVDSLYYCPTSRKEYKLSVIDTSVIKRIVIESPIDSVFIANVESDFLKSTIGALKIENHGNINNGVKSWDEKSGN